jgi:hypothetical protein
MYQILGQTNLFAINIWKSANCVICKTEKIFRPLTPSVRHTPARSPTAILLKGTVARDCPAFSTFHQSTLNELDNGHWARQFYQSACAVGGKDVWGWEKGETDSSVHVDTWPCALTVYTWPHPHGYRVKWTRIPSHVNLDPDRVKCTQKHNHFHITRTY